MPIAVNTGTGEIPLKFAANLTNVVSKLWESGEVMEKASPVTQDLLRYWFLPPHTDTRVFNFHQGQKQAILNAVYLHEILKTNNTIEMYDKIDPELLSEMDASTLKQKKYQFPKYAFKMATGTGKTWVMNALVIWQYLNSKYEQTKSGRYTKNFLLIAPGLIVYERLLDAYLGKEKETGERNFQTSDYFRYKDLFLPPSYVDEVFGFIQSNVVKKEEIGRKVTGEGMIAISNWHLFMEEKEEQETASPLDSPSRVVKDIFPITPGTNVGHDLNSLDNAYFKGNEIKYLADLPDLMVINDEAHHIHENKTYGTIEEVEWQKSLNTISETKGSSFIQLDFSATPYDTTGSGQNRTKHYFPHIMVDFSLKEAIYLGLVKTIAIDKRKEIATLELDYKAIRNEKGEPIALSEGQKLMIRAGLKKIKILEKHFLEITEPNNNQPSYPKMLIVCEDTNVSPLITSFLKDEGLSEDDVLQIDSNRKGEVKPDVWASIKHKLFSIDSRKEPKVVISVLMLREGFDVNNICVIVPLRASSAPILLEQTIGRGLRLMWRGPEFADIKEENRKRLLLERKEPLNYLDILSIIEHPEFMKFYDDLIKDGQLAVVDGDPKGREGVTGDIIVVGLKEEYEKFDIYFPIIVRDEDEELKPLMIDINNLNPMPTGFSLEQLKRMIGQQGEKFYSEEMTKKTRYGEYIVDARIFNAESYNEYLEKVLYNILNVSGRLTGGVKHIPFLQFNNIELTRKIDSYIRSRLFEKDFNPMEDENWRVLLLEAAGVSTHIIKEFRRVIFELQNNVEITNPKVEKRYFSEVNELRMRDSYSLDITKTIYQKLPYPSNKGILEKNFMLYADSDAEVDSLIKIDQYKHEFAYITYIRTDGLLTPYFPDFIVKIKDKVYIVETKATKDLKEQNVKQKQLATIEWTKRINRLAPDDRMKGEWVYVLLGEDHFYSLSKNGASLREIIDLAVMTEKKVKEVLF